MSVTHRRKAFTLVELLVVMAIIGLLVAIMVPVIFVVQRKARNARIALEVAALAQAIEAYKLDSGDYPPNFDDEARLRRHLALRWQQIPTAEVTTIVSYRAGQAKDINPAEALVFWLGGPSTNGQLKANDILPLSGAGEAKSYFNFDQGRLTDTDADGWSEYAPSGCLNAPYVYFDARSYPYYNSAPFNVGTIDGAARGSIKPAPKQAGATLQAQFVNPTTFQIHTAGQDGNFGGGWTATTYYPAGPYAAADKDNIGNFSEGNTLEDAKP